MFRNRILSPEEALTRAAAYCSKGERTPADIREKLLGWGIGRKEAESIIDRLTDENFLCEERYIRAFIHDKSTYNHWGRVKIRYALRYKQLNESEIDRLLTECIDEENYLQTLAGILRSKAHSLPRPLTPECRRKLYSFAAQRGYESECISRAFGILPELSHPEDTD